MYVLTERERERDSYEPVVHTNLTKFDLEFFSFDRRQKLENLHSVNFFLKT